MNQVYSQAGITAYDTEVSSYPVDVRFPTQERYNRFFAVPILGLAARMILLIPHLLILYVLGAVVGLLYLVTWIPVLLSGQYPSWGYSVVGGYIRWVMRVNAYTAGLSDSYPAFALGDESSRDMLMMVQPTQPSRFYAIPVIGCLVKCILVIPHAIVLYVLGFIVALTHLVAWIPVLFTGQYPDWARGLNEGYIRWYARVMAYFFGLCDTYPPFQLGR